MASALLLACAPAPVIRTAEPAPPLATPQAAAATASARICPAPAELTGAPASMASGFRGGPCPAEVCPTDHTCGCDDAGRIIFIEVNRAGVRRDRRLIDHDPQGRRREIRLDREADGYIDARFVYAHGADGTCVVEARDDDLDGAIETVCTYERTCPLDATDCRATVCEAAVPRPAGRWCESSRCPPGARCSCDERERVIEALYNLDQDPAYERRTTMSYRADDDRVAEEQHYIGGALVRRFAFTYDDRGRMVSRLYYGADGDAEREEHWTWGGTDTDWITFEERQRGVVSARGSRTYRQGQLLTETHAVPGHPLEVLRYFPGAADGIMQPVVISSALISPKQVACQRDADCVVVPKINCCPCSAMGVGAVVNRRHAQTLAHAARRSCGATVKCPAARSTHPTCAPKPEPACMENICTLRSSWH